jgi:hypothetical protein
VLIVVWGESVKLEDAYNDRVLLLNFLVSVKHPILSSLPHDTQTDISFRAFSISL